MLEALRQARIVKGQTTREVAAALGCHQSQYSRVESGRRRPSPDLANKIACHFNNVVTRDQILFPQDDVDLGKKPVRSAQRQPQAVEAR